jgi:anti-sigma factor RsiW
MSMHKQVAELLPAYALGDLREPQATNVSTHLAECPDCRSELGRLQRLLGYTGGVQQRALDSDACTAARRRLLASLQAQPDAAVQTGTSSPQPSRWIFQQWHRFQRNPIMQTRSRRYVAAIAAAVIATVGALAMFQALLSPRPVYAIEQTIAALRNARNVHMVGTIAFPGDPTYPAEIWATPADDELETEDMKMVIHQPDGDRLWTVHDRMSYQHLPKEQTVIILPGKAIVLSPWLGSRFLEISKADGGVNITYGKDAETGADCVFMTCAEAKFGNSWWIQCDPATKLPVRIKGWHNLRREGPPVEVFDRIVYNEPLPEGFFIFHIPEGTEVIRYTGPSKDPNAGLATAGLTHEEACRQIVTQYWQAVIARNWKQVHNLRPDLTVTYWPKKYRDNPPAEVIEIGQPFAGPDVAEGTIAPAKLRLADGTIREVNLVVSFRQIEDKESCIISGEYLGQR